MSSQIKNKFSTLDDREPGAPAEQLALISAAAEAEAARIAGEPPAGEWIGGRPGLLRRVIVWLLLGWVWQEK